MRMLVPLSLMALLGCTPPPPELAQRISPAARAADFPDLIPLGPAFADIDALLPDVDAAARALEFRAADLRARAAALRAMPLP